MSLPSIVWDLFNATVTRFLFQETSTYKSQYYVNLYYIKNNYELNVFKNNSNLNDKNTKITFLK